MRYTKKIILAYRKYPFLVFFLTYPSHGKDAGVEPIRCNKDFFRDLNKSKYKNSQKTAEGGK